LGPWRGAAGRERAAGGRYSSGLVPHAVSPHLQGSQLRDPVLDVIEGVSEEVGLGQPACDPQLIIAAPVNAPLEPLPEAQPLPVSRIAVVTLAARVDPVLERVHGGDVCKHDQDALKMALA